MAALFDVYESLVRCAPGDDASTLRALAACAGAPSAPRIIDLGSGPGPATIPLARAGAHVTAIELHAPFVAEVRRRAAASGVGDRVDAREGDMAKLPFEDGAFDIVWSEGAAYSIGVERAAELWLRLVPPGGWLAVTELCWRVGDAPDEAREHWASDYPSMGDVATFEARIAAGGWQIVDGFWLPQSAWDAYYDPMRDALARARSTHADPAAQAALDALDREIAVYDTFGATFGYRMLVARRPAEGE